MKCAIGSVLADLPAETVEIAAMVLGDREGYDGLGVSRALEGLLGVTFLPRTVNEHRAGACLCGDEDDYPEAAA